MEMKHNILDTSAVIALQSNILGTPSDSKDFECKIQDLIGEGVTRVILDLSQVKRINSTGLAILITGFNLLTNSGGKFALANLNEFVKGALTITKLNNVFEYYDSIDEAIAH